MIPARALLLLVFLLMGAAGTALGQSSPSGPAAPAALGPLRPLLPVGPIDGNGWQGAVEKDVYVLDNARSPGAVRYFYALHRGKGPLTVRVTVSFEPGAGTGAAGLLYGFDPQDRSYCVLLLKPDRQLVLLRREADGFKPMIQAGGSSVREGANTLELRVERNRVDAFVNGAGIATIAGTSVCTGPGVGIAAISPGRFRFTDFQLH